jgi:predicted transcriptional regulator
VAKFIAEHDDSWVPESFKEGMKAAAEGRFVDMETALFETPPPHLR